MPIPSLKKVKPADKTNADEVKVDGVQQGQDTGKETSQAGAEGEVAEVSVNATPGVKQAQLAKIEKTVKQPIVRVATTKNHKSVIGGVTYNFIKGKEQPVPIQVKEILARANLLKAL